MTAFQERRVNRRMRESEDGAEETKIQVYPKSFDMRIDRKKHSHLVCNQYQYLSLDTHITSSCFHYDNWLMILSLQSLAFVWAFRESDKKGVFASVCAAAQLLNLCLSRSIHWDEVNWFQSSHKGLKTIRLCSFCIAQSQRLRKPKSCLSRFSSDFRNSKFPNIRRSERLGSGLWG